MSLQPINVNRVMPSIVWNGPGWPSFRGPIRTIAEMKKNRYKMVRRGQKWVVRAKHPYSDFVDHPALNEDSDVPGPYKTKYVGPGDPDTWHRRYFADIRLWDWDYWFHTKSEALMFMLRCD